MCDVWSTRTGGLVKCGISHFFAYNSSLHKAKSTKQKAQVSALQIAEKMADLVELTIESNEEQ